MSGPTAQPPESLTAFCFRPFTVYCLLFTLRGEATVSQVTEVANVSKYKGAPITDHSRPPSPDNIEQLQSLNTLEIPDLLANLVDRSLVVVDQDSWRYELTESMRAFLQEQQNEDIQATRKKHAEFAAWYAEQVFDST